MSMTVHIDLEGFEEVRAYFQGMERRASRALFMPIMLKAFAPIAAAERAGVHSISGALATSLKERAGSGDRAGRISVFSSATATRKQLIGKWGQGRKQQQGWAARMDPKGGRKAVFYGKFVEYGHKKGLGRSAAPPHPFAAPAIESLGPAAADQAEAGILQEILGE